MNFKKPTNSFEMIRATSFHSLTIMQGKAVIKIILGSHLNLIRNVWQEHIKEEQPFYNNKEKGKGGE